MAGVPSWPASLPQTPRRQSWTGGAQESRATFQPDYGPPVVRRRTTGDAMLYECVFPQMSGAQRAAFVNFWHVDLQGGSLSYSWRDPVLGDVARWRILGGSGRAWDFTALGADLHDLSLSLMRLPGTPWWAAYVRPNENEVPVVVADWNAGVYGYEGNRVAASALPTISGTFDVWSVSTSNVETFAAAQVIAAGGIPATAPLNVKRRTYFAV